MDLNLKKRAKSVIERTSNYKTQLKVFQSNYNNIRNEYSELKSIIELNPSVNEFLKVLQLKQHENSVGTYEKLLTSLLMEVMPGYREVVLNLTTLRQSPALDVLIKKDPNNPAEDVLRGTGGSVTNIIVAGFRIISVIRSGNRKFLLLDEADCWLKEDYFPSFSKMLKEVSEKLGVQILLISHDKDSYFSGVIDHQVEIYKDNSGKIQSRFNELPDWDVDEDILRSIRLENFQSHEDTFIPLSPTITILRGDNDLGKSSIASAFRSVFYGEGAESDIKHFTQKSTVTVEFNNEGKCLVWERKAKGSPLESYTLYSQTHGYNSPLHKTSGLTRGTVPDWLMEETGLGKFDDLDVQLTWQKEPLAFLSAGPHVRAKALSIGSEADHVQKMMILAKKKNTENKSLLKSKESLIESQRQYIIPLKKSSSINEKDVEELISSLEDKENRIEKIKNLLNNMETVISKNKLYERSKIKSIEIKTNEKEINNIHRIVEDIDQMDKKFNILKLIAVINKIEINVQDGKSTELSNFEKGFNKEILKREILEKSKNISSISIDVNIKEKIKDLKTIGVSINKSQKIEKILSSIKKVSLIKNIDTENSKKILMNAFVLRWDKFNKVKSIISSVSQIAEIKISNENKVKIEDMKQIGLSIKNISDIIEENKKNMEDSKVEYIRLDSELKTLYPICPTCHQKWDHKH